jgi:pimeloyl-ACP methyl ester carboxylesterase
VPITISNYDSSFVTDVTQPGNHAGGGKPLVLVHGFSQTAEQFKFQIEGLADRYRGDRAQSTRPWRIEETELRSQDTPPCRGLARSAHRRESDHATLLGHSMGRSVIWAY